MPVAESSVRKLASSASSLGAMVFVIASCHSVPVAHPTPRAALPLPALPAAWDSGGTGAVIGTLVDSVTGAPIRGANVFVHPSSAVTYDARRSQGRYVTIDSLGSFAFLRLPPQEYTLGARLIGWNTCVAEVSVSPNVVDTMRLVLAQPKWVIIDGPTPPVTDYCVRSSRHPPS